MAPTFDPLFWRMVPYGRPALSSVVSADEGALAVDGDVDRGPDRPPVAPVRS